MAYGPGDRELVEFHVRKAVAAAKRKNTIITLSEFKACLRARNPGLNIEDSYILDRLVRAARDSNVVIEIDRGEH